MAVVIYFWSSTALMLPIVVTNEEWHLSILQKISRNNQPDRDSKGHNEAQTMDQEIGKHVTQWIVTTV